MTARNHAGRWPITLVWIHAVLFAALAAGSYVSPETLFGDAAWLPLARLAVLLCAAALSAVTVLLVSAARSGSARQVGTALLAALVIDAQAPLLLFSLPASLEYYDRALGLRWVVLPLASLLLVAVSVYTVLSLRRRLELLQTAA